MLLSAAIGFALASLVALTKLPELATCIGLVCRMVLQDMVFHFVGNWIIWSIIIFSVQYILRRSEKIRGLTIIALLLASVVVFMNAVA